MDRVGARNTLIVLLTVVILTIASFAVLLILVLRGDSIPDLLQGICTLLLGTLTGSAVTLGAQPKVPNTAASPATVVNQNLSQAPGVQVVTDPSATDVPAVIHGDELPAEPGPVIDEPEPGFPEGLPFSPDNGPDDPTMPSDEPGNAPKGEF